MRILLVTAQLPHLRTGGGQRTALIHRALQEHGEVTILLMREGQPLHCKTAPAPGIAAEIGYPEPGPLHKYRRAPVIDPLVRSVLDLDDFDMVVSRYLGPLTALPEFRGRAIIDADDAYYRYPVGTRWYSHLLATAKSRARTARGRSVLRRVDHVWFCCQRDFDVFSLRTASILPNAVAHSDITAESVAFSEPVVLMVGPTWYRPNGEAVEGFIRHCWPEIRRVVPEARFRVVGSASADWCRQWGSIPGVECAGFVDDLVAEYRRARLAVVPIRTGGGTQIKALESLSHGRVPVVSSFVAEGYAPYLKHEEALYVADDPAQQIHRVIEILQTPSKGERVARRGQEICRQTFSHGRFVETVTTSLAPLVRAIPRDRSR
jgi:glycosyltransferase involved in cell wall biosynthesis